MFRISVIFTLFLQILAKSPVIWVSETEPEVPKLLLTAPPIGREDAIFLLTGSGVSEEFPEKSFFGLNVFSGKIFLLKSFDSEVNDLKVNSFDLKVSAEDERGQPFNYSFEFTVKVKEENNNWPKFSRDSYEGHVTENGVEGAPVLTVSAHDRDRNDVIRYSIETNKLDERGRLLFDIDMISGEIWSAVCCLKRQLIDSYSLRVCADDGIHRTCCHVTVIVDDADDSRKTIDDNPSSHKKTDFIKVLTGSHLLPILLIFGLIFTLFVVFLFRRIKEDNNTEEEDKKVFQISKYP